MEGNYLYLVILGLLGGAVGMNISLSASAYGIVIGAAIGFLISKQKQEESEIQQNSDEETETTSGFLASLDSSERSEKETVFITSDVGEVDGSDGITYDLAQGDFVTLPKVDVEPLLKQNNARKIETSTEPEKAKSNRSVAEKLESFYEAEIEHDVDLEKLRTVQSKERSTDSLQNLPDGFYKEVSQYLHELRQQRRSVAEEVEDPFSSKEVAKLTDELETAEEITETIFERRLGKVIKKASLEAVGLQEERKSTTQEEEMLMEMVVDDIKTVKQEVLENLQGYPEDVSPTK